MCIRKNSQNNKRLWFVSVFLILVLGQGLQTQESPAPILFVVDASGSMTELFKGTPRMVVARVMLFEKLKNIDPKIPIGLVAYGNRIAGCRSHRIYAKIRTKNRKTLVKQIQSLSPAGSTPLGNTLRMVATKVLPYHPGTRVVIISDGAESCGGDPVREIQRLKKRGYGIQVNVIGLDVDILTSIQLRALARAGDGAYFDVKNHRDFATAIRKSTQQNHPHKIFKKEKEKLQPAKSGSLLEITKVYEVQDASGNMVWKIKYHFEATRPGDYYVVIKSLAQVATEGFGGHIPGDDRLGSSSGDAYYMVKKGRGEITITKPKDNARQMFLQGELWDTSNVPMPIYISNFKRAP